MAELALARPFATNDPSSIKFMHEDLTRSGLVPEDLQAYPVAPIAMGTCPGYCIPYGHDMRMYRVRYKREEDKYIQPKGIMNVWWSHTQNRDTFRSAPTLYIIEGEKKAAKFVKTWPHLPTLGLGGCWMFGKKNEAGTPILLPEILSCLSPGMNVIAIFDGDILTKPNIQKAAFTLNSLLEQQRCVLKIQRTPVGKGVDDWLVENPKAELFDLIDVPFDKLAISHGMLYNALGIQLTEKGSPHPNENNIRKLLQSYFGKDLVKDKRRELKYKGRYIDDNVLLAEATKYIQEEHIVNAYVSRIKTALEFCIQDTRTDLIKDLFENLVWDEEPRLNSWGAEFFESDMPEYCAEWGRLLMTGLALRVIQPGAKVDVIPILVGEQGIGKTTFFEELAIFDGEKYYHSAPNITPDVGDQHRSQCIAFEKCVVVDLGEGAAFDPRRTNKENFKQFITQTHDEYRPVYGKSTIINPRSYIFVGTSNRRDQITDHSGSRRFLPVYVTKIKHLPYEEKMQILAEVVAKRHEIIDSDWWKLTVDMSKMPQPLREEHPHIKDAQELVNTQFTKEDEFTDFVLSILETGSAAKYLETTAYHKKGDLFINGNYLAVRLQGKILERHINSRLNELALDNRFPWELRKDKPRPNSLSIPAEYLVYYTRGVVDPPQLTGFSARKRT